MVVVRETKAPLQVGSLQGYQDIGQRLFAASKEPVVVAVDEHRAGQTGRLNLDAGRFDIFVVDAA